MDSKEYKETMKPQNILRVIEETKDERYLQPFDISKFPRVRTITAPLPGFEWVRKRFKDSK